MSTVSQTVKMLLLSSPSIFKSPLHIAVHLFAVPDNGYEWRNGELVATSSSEPMPTHIDMSDLEELRAGYEDQKAKNEARSAIPGTSELSRALASERVIGLKGHLLEVAAEQSVRQFINDNIEEISQAPITTDFGRRGIGDYFLTRAISLEGAKGIAFPDDIQPDWAQALWNFLRWWEVRIGATHTAESIPADKGEPRYTHWPEVARDAFVMIRNERKRVDSILTAKAYRALLQG